MHSELSSLGWSTHHARQLEPGEDTLPARVAVDHGALLTVLSPRGTHDVSSPRTEGVDRCVTGDWVLLRERAGAFVVDRRLERRTALVRRAVGRTSAGQVVAANLDVAFVVTAMDLDFVPARIDRYIAAVRGGGITPVVVLNKADLDLANARRYTARLSPDVEVVVASAVLGIGIEDLRAHLGVGVTVGLVGSSGVGKSSLVNALAKDDRQFVTDIRADGRGRHTTTRRELVRLPSGAVLVDTPGMRELGLVDGDLSGTFPELDALAAGCRFRDCEHETEPDCAVQEAIADGRLDPDRVKSWRKLARELAGAEARAARKGRERRRVVRSAQHGRRVRDD